jgi:hypothetical protein
MVGGWNLSANARRLTIIEAGGVKMEYRVIRLTESCLLLSFRADEATVELRYTSVPAQVAVRTRSKISASK